MPDAALTSAPPVTWRGPPSATAYMLGALLRGPGPRRIPSFPGLQARWQGFTIRPDQHAAVRRVTGLEPGSGLDVLLPQVIGFRALMALLTHRAVPLPIWRVLQVRSELLLHRSLPAGAGLELRAGVATQRILEKGMEVDLTAELRAEGQPVWEGTTTFYYRGRFGEPGPEPATRRPPAVGGTPVARWRSPRGGGWRMGQLTGDFNPLHWWSGQARRQGFAGAFHHPQVVLGQGLSRLALPEPPFTLATWVRGQVYQGAEVTLRAESAPGAGAFAVSAEGDERPALLGAWRAGEASRPFSTSA